MRWARVKRVASYKRDNLTTDEVMLVFEMAEHPSTVQEVSEEWPGFQDLLGSLERELGISPTWYLDVIQPPFAANHRILFDRVAGGPTHEPERAG